MQEQTHIYLSYAREDESVVEELRRELSQHGFEPWSKERFSNTDEHTTVPHSRETDIFLACLSNNAVDSKGRLEATMQAELSQLWRRIHSSTFVIPILLEDCAIPESLKAFEPISVFTEEGLAKLFDVIAEVIDSRRTLIDAFDPISTEAKTPPLQANETLEGPLDPNSPSDWGVDLRGLLKGEREDSLQRLGGVEEYIEVMLAEAANGAAAKQAFDDAVEQLVQTWQPSSLDSEFQLTHALDLVSAYTPRGGFVKVIALIQSISRLTMRESRDAYSIDDDIYLKAFVALENYYRAAPKSPEDQSPGYQTYVDLLKGNLGSPIYCGYALRRLVELKVFELGSKEVESLIEINPGSLAALVALMIDPSRRSRSEEELSMVYSLCLQAGSEVERHFEYAVSQSGGRMERQLEEGPKIAFRGATFIIVLSEHSKHRYWEMIFKRENAKGLKRYAALTANA